MRIEEKAGNVLLYDVEDFNVEQIFECGQCFHFQKLADMDYVTVAYGKALRVTQEDNNVILHNTDLNEYNSIWKNYFDMDTDYGAIKKWLLDKDDRLTAAVTEKYGIRILRQEFHEMLMSFIISQNNQIPRIKQIVGAISERYGTLAGEIEGRKYYNFPDMEAIHKISEEDYRQLKTGFRASYLRSASDFMESGLTAKAFQGLSYEQSKEKLMVIRGVGDKVANCVLLFGLSYRNAFPVDVWVKRIMEQVYFNEDTPKEKIMEFAKENFGEYGGYAQQYLFYYARDLGDKGKKG